ncbi:hypothetical protein OS493_019762 [Desmophyllum pertusum]|uniref:Uncharacterized protein n=1 Tax=Desmophyllum pertusum TaxID=174260 RepID=A0A9W9YZ71_9CNID|nr:hypothetical protein OS493_019762 [Desmophyllum pertusum]
MSHTSVTQQLRHLLPLRGSFFFPTTVSDRRLVSRRCPRLPQKLPFLPSAVRIPHRFLLARLSPVHYAAVCSSNFAVVPDVFGREDASVAPILENNLSRNKRNQL